jgi:hypothetical protein
MRAEAASSAGGANNRCSWSTDSIVGPVVASGMGGRQADAYGRLLTDSYQQKKFNQIAPQHKAPCTRM